MKIKPEQLNRTLNNQRLALYWLSGDETLLMQEAADQIRLHFREQGFLEREVFNVDRSFDWQHFSHAVGNLSLFSQQKIVECRLNSAMLEDVGRKALLDYLNEPSPDILLLIISPRLESGTAKTKWFKAIEANGAFVQIWPINREGLGAWLAQRLIREGINAAPDALELLANKVEGNLLAAMQEIEKLKLLAKPDEKSPLQLDVNTVMQVVADSSRYNVYQLVDAALLGDAVRSQKILMALRAEGIFPLPIVGAITRELRGLLPMIEKKQQGQGVNAIMQTAHVWFNRKRAVGNALERIDTGQVWQFLDHARLIDQSIKGMSRANTWDELSLLLLRISGQQTATLRQFT
ncbi:MAG TPA: DNA polymerase III subunit delta [Gammaproteobacteria bacterium]|nr:DNA polymerase III subunit delta [Gammaproteobacteria bacterium]MDP6732725.1 DNA polymerase III subunit delta [Gammaproteobacteria bacterium]HAJ76462.1 DNA polymerase III subunit delta [Gammaproteobacteria bacterium]